MARRPQPPKPKIAPARTEPDLESTGDEPAGAWLGERLRRLALGLTAALVAARAYWPSEHATEIDTGVGLVWVLALLVAAGIAVASMLIGGAVRLRWSWADGAVYALMFLVGISSTRGAERRVAINLAWEWAALGVAYALVRHLPRSRGESSVLAGALLASAVAVSAYGVYQVPVEFPVLHAAYRNDPETVLRSVGIDPNSPARQAFENRLVGSNEPYATFALPNSLAGYLVGPMALILAVGLETLTGPRGRGSRLVALGSAALPALLLLGCLILTKSRSAYLGLLVAAVVLVWRRRRIVSARTLALAGAALGMVVLGLVVAASAAGRLDRQVLTQSTKSLRYRAEYWAGTWRLIVEEPGAFWHGVGPGNFADPYLAYKLARSSEEIRDPHNLVLEVWATAGLVATLMLLAALALAFFNLFGPPRQVGAMAKPGDPDHDRPPRRPETDGDPPGSSGWLWASAGLSWLLVVLLGRLDPFDVRQADLLARWLILGGAWGLTVLLILPLWRRRPIAAEGPGVAALAMVVNLLAAGGIGIPAVALALWSWVALGLNLRDDRPCGRLRLVGGRGSAFLLAIAWAALVGSFSGAVGPWWRAEAAMSEAEAALRDDPPRVQDAREFYSRAARLDRIAVTPWLDLANLEYEYWASRGAKHDDLIWTAITPTLDKALKRDPRSLDLQSRKAAIAGEILARHGDKLPIDQMLRLQAQRTAAARIATRLYPNNPLHHAELAAASLAIGDRESGIQEAREALRLDELTPHDDKKLPESLRSQLEQIIRESEKSAGPD